MTGEDSADVVRFDRGQAFQVALEITRILKTKPGEPPVVSNDLSILRWWAVVIAPTLTQKDWLDLLGHMRRESYPHDDDMSAVFERMYDGLRLEDGYLVVAAADDAAWWPHSGRSNVLPRWVTPTANTGNAPPEKLLAVADRVVEDRRCGKRSRGSCGQPLRRRLPAEIGE